MLFCKINVGYIISKIIIIVNLPNSKGSVSIVFPSSNRFLKFLFRKTNKKETSVIGPQRLLAVTK